MKKILYGRGYSMETTKSIAVQQAEIVENLKQTDGECIDLYTEKYRRKYFSISGSVYMTMHSTKGSLVDYCNEIRSETMLYCHI